MVTAFLFGLSGSLFFGYLAYVIATRRVDAAIPPRDPHARPQSYKATLGAHRAHCRAVGHNAARLDGDGEQYLRLHTPRPGRYPLKGVNVSPMCPEPHRKPGGRIVSSCAISAPAAQSDPGA